MNSKKQSDSSDNPDKNVYILGAGFSYHAGIPLMSDFLDKARHYMHVKYTEFNEVFEYLHNMLPASRTIKHNLDNIEELFGLLELDIDVNRQNKELITIRNSLINLICKTIDESDHTITRGLSKFPNRCLKYDIPCVKRRGYFEKKDEYGFTTSINVLPVMDIYMHFAALVLRIYEDEPDFEKDVIISFNYDTVVEKAVEHFNHKIDYVLNRPDFNQPFNDNRIKILKLHGSIEFKKNPDGGFVFGNQCRTTGYEDTPQLIVPPSWNKPKYQEDVLPIWEQAYKELITARRIIIIGYSMPETDIFFKHLLTLALSQNNTLDKIIVVDTCDTVDETYRNMVYENFHRNYVFINTGLIGFLLHTRDNYLNYVYHGFNSREDISNMQTML